ncbi:MAG: prepilin peptidase [Bdellovibrionota bacterium]
MAHVPFWLANVSSVVLGLIVGSFVNVIVARMPIGLSIITPGSHCPTCKARIRWYDNIPILSFILLLGRCRACGAVISFRYPTIEFLTAVLFLATNIRFGWSALLFIRDWPFVAVLIAITFIDFEHRIIPDIFSIGGVILGLLTAFFVPELGLFKAVLGAGLGFCVFYGLAMAYQVFSGRAGLGGGDIKLLAMLGAFLGPSGVFTTILIGSVLGSIAGIAWAMVTRKKDVMKVSIPFGPFLVTGGIFHYLLGGFIWLPFMTLI